MTRREHQAEKVIADVIVDRGVEIGNGQFLLRLELVAELRVLSLEQRVATQEVDGAVPGGRHEPRSWIVGDAGVGPLFERRQQCVLRQIFGDTDVTHDARESGDELRRLDPPDGVDGAMCVGGWHGDQLERGRRPVQPAGATPSRAS